MSLLFWKIIQRISEYNLMRNNPLQRSLVSSVTCITAHTEGPAWFVMCNDYWNIDHRMWSKRCLLTRRAPPKRQKSQFKNNFYSINFSWPFYDAIWQEGNWVVIIWHYINITNNLTSNFFIGVIVYPLSNMPLWRNDCLTPIHKYWARSKCH